MDIKKPIFRDIDYYILWLLESTTAITARARARELSNYNITREQAAVLSIVCLTESKSTPTDISRILLRQTHATSALLIRMEKVGLIKKVKDLNKKNQVRIALTDYGEKIYNETHGGDVIHNIMSILSDEERNQLIKTLKKLLNKALDISIVKPEII